MRRSFLFLAALALGCGSPTLAPDGGTDAAVDASADAGVDATIPVPPSHAAAEPFVDLVDPFIGTGGVGFNDLASAFPGPQRPFGMVRPSAGHHGEAGGARGSCTAAGFRLRDPYVSAFSHMRMSGTGIPDYGSSGLMPVPGMDPCYVSRRARARLVVGRLDGPSPGYFAMTLERGRCASSSPPPIGSPATATPSSPGDPLGVLSTPGTSSRTG